MVGGTPLTPVASPLRLDPHTQTVSLRAVPPIGDLRAPGGRKVPLLEFEILPHGYLRVATSMSLLDLSYSAPVRPEGGAVTEKGLERDLASGWLTRFLGRLTAKEEGKNAAGWSPF